MGDVIVGIVGLLVSGAVVLYRKGGAPEWKPQQCWILGLGGLFPGWLVAFLSLLPSATAPGVDTPLPPRALFSSIAALLGVIATDYLLRRLQKSGCALRPWTYWLIGWVSLIPAWCIAALHL